MAVFIFIDQLAGVSSREESVISMANLLADSGHDTYLVSYSDTSVSERAVSSKFPVNSNVTVLSIRWMTVQGGEPLFKKERAAFSIGKGCFTTHINEHDVLVFQEMNRLTSESDVIIFTHPMQVSLFTDAIYPEVCSAKTMLRVHDDALNEDADVSLFMDCLTNIDGVQVTSQSMRQKVRDLCEFDETKIHYIPSVCSLNSVKKKQHGKRRITAIGALSEPQSQYDAVRAITQLHGSKVQLDIWGNVEGAYNHFIKTFVQTDGIDTKTEVQLTGRKSEIYEDVDILVILGPHEGYRQTITEAASRGIPTIAYGCGSGVDDFVLDGENGYDVAVGDIEKLARTIGTFIESPDLHKTLGARALKTVGERHNADVALLGYNEVIPAGSPHYDTHFTDHFLRDGYVPFDVNSVQVRPLRFLGKTYAFEVSLIPVDDVEFEMVKITPRGRITRLKTKKTDNILSAVVPRFSKGLRRISIKSVIVARGETGACSYILNFTRNARVEQLDELSRARNTLHAQD